MKYINLSLSQSPLGFNIVQTDHIILLVSEWFIDSKFCKVDTLFQTDTSYEEYLRTGVPLIGDSLRKAEHK